MTELEWVPGVGPAIIKKLAEANVTNTEVLALQNENELFELTRMSEGTCRKIIRAARQLIGGYTIMTGTEVKEEMKRVPVLSTGIEGFDRILLGGIRAGSIVEFYGSARSGKTILSHQLAVMAQLSPERGGLDGKVLWFSTDNSFRPELIERIAVRLGTDPTTALGNILVQRVLDRDHLPEVLEQVPHFCSEHGVRLVVIDSLGALFHIELVQLSEVRMTERKLLKVLKTFRRITRLNNTIVLYTNWVYYKYANFGSNPNAPVGGHVLSHSSDYRFYLRKGRKEDRKVTLQDHTSLPEDTVELEVGWGGFYSRHARRKIVDIPIGEFALEQQAEEAA